MINATGTAVLIPAERMKGEALHLVPHRSVLYQRVPKLLAHGGQTPAFIGFATVHVDVRLRAPQSPANSPRPRMPT